MEGRGTQEEMELGEGLRFDGQTYDPALDRERLRLQLGRVFALMIDGEWRSLAEIETTTGAPQASISARLRDLRKPRFGSYLVERRRRENLNRGRCGTFEYRVLPRRAEP